MTRIIKSNFLSTSLDNIISHNRIYILIYDFRNLFERRGFDLSFYPRLDYQANMTQTTSANETNTSMHMKALALKYLSDEQLAELAIQRQGSASVKHLMLGNVQATNMSFATMRYLERYQLLPGKNNVQTEGKGFRLIDVQNISKLIELRSSFVSLK